MKPLTKKGLFLGAGAAALALSGVTFDIQRRNADEGAPFLNPLLMARALCGDNGDGLAKRRAFFIRAAQAYAKETATSAGDGPALWPNLGDIHLAVSTQSEDAQAYFDQGLAFTYGFNHEEAVDAFRRAQELDPDCAMCFWGEAFALGPNINAPMTEDAAAPAFAALTKAVERAAGASEKEQALIAALEKRYVEHPPADRSALDAAFADAMDALAVRFPDDDFIAALAAEANMDTQPWNYWAADGRTPYGRTARTISLLEAVLARNPNHSAAIHLYIHMTEASRDPYRAAEHAEKLAGLAPGLGHLVHMPSHTFYRIGRFGDSLKTNIDAVHADEEFLSMSRDASILYEYGYYTHNIHFAMTSAQMAGDSATALGMAEKLDARLPIDMASTAPWVQPIKAAPYFAMVQFAEPQAILGLPDPGDALPFLRGAWRYARGEAFARLGEADKARAETETISTLMNEIDFSALEAGGVPVSGILNIARLTVLARAAAAEGDYTAAIEAMEEAVAIQEGLPYTEPPFWYYPARQTLAAMLLRDGQAERAEHMFLQTLAESPNNAWALYGLSRAYAEQDARNGEKYAKALFKEAWLGPKNAASLDRL